MQFVPVSVTYSDRFYTGFSGFRSPTLPPPSPLPSTNKLGLIKCMVSSDLVFLAVSLYTVAQAIISSILLNKMYLWVILTFAIRDIHFTYTVHQGTLHCPFLLIDLSFINIGSFYINRFMETVQTRRLKEKFNFEILLCSNAWLGQRNAF